MPNDNEIMRFRAAPARGVQGKVDRKNGIIHGIAVVTMGEALGHGVNLDEEFIDSTVKNGNAMPEGLKSRFGHPNMSSSAVGTLLGRVKNFRKVMSDGIARAVGDLHLTESAKSAPKGNLYTHVLDLAEHDPDMFGTSIVFKAGETYKRDDKGDKVYKYTRDGSYNEEFDNIESKLFVEQKELRADDVVDEPAANEGGLFSAFSEDQLAAIVTRFLDENPEVFELLKRDDIDEICSAFKQRYEAHKNPVTKPKEPVIMADKSKQDIVEDSAEALESAKQEASQATAEHLKSLLSEFPQETAMAAFESGKTVNDVKIEEYDKVKAQNTELQAEVEQLKSVKKAEGEDKPVEFDEEEQVEGNAREAFEAKVSELRETGLGAGEAFRKAMKDNAELAKKAYK